MRRILASCLLCAACATQSFQPQFAPPAAPKPSVVIADLVKSQARSERAVAVGLTSDPMRLFAWDFQRGLLWEKPVVAKSAPLVAADAVVLQEADGIVVRDLANGEVRALVDSQGALLGADGAGDRVVVSYAQNLPNHPGGVALVEGNSVRWRQLLGLPVGVPALVGTYVVVPWATQRLSVLDARDGAELERFHYRSSVMGQALLEQGQLYVGQLGLFAADKALFEQPGLRRTPFTPAKRSLPGQPALLRDGYAPIPDPDNAAHRLQLTWRMQQRESEGLATANDLLLLRFYRILFGLEARSDEVRWVRTFDHDLVGASMQDGGAWIADTEGQLSYLDPQGETRFSQSLGRGLRVIVLRPGDYVPGPSAPPPAAGETATAAMSGKAAPATAKSSSGDTKAPDKDTLRAQLFAAAALDDDRLGAGRAYAATHLARCAQAQATADLVQLCTHASGPEPVRLAACTQLAGRSNGEAAVLQALRVRASFLENTLAPPVGALAQAAAKMQLKPAGALLISHLDDPNTAARDLAPLLQALEDLGEHAALPSAERFVRLHHAEPEGSELAPALVAALHALGALHARAQRATLVEISADPLTPKALRDQAQAALGLLDAEPSKPSANKTEAAPAAAAVDEVQADPRQYALTPEVITRTLNPLRDKLGRCLRADESKPHSGRSSLVIDAKGRVEGVFVLPATLQSCVEPILREAHFPSTRLGRQRITHVFHAGAPLKRP